MFGTISFTKNGRYKISKDHLFSQDENERLTRRFACRTCRLFKVKCSGDLTQCARCRSLGIDCTYDQPTEPRSRRPTSGSPRNNSPMDRDPISTATSPTPRPSSAQDSGRNDVEEAPMVAPLEPEQSGTPDDPFIDFTLESSTFQDLHQALLIDQKSIPVTLEMGFSLAGNDTSSLDLLFDNSNFAELDKSQWSFHTHGPATLAACSCSVRHVGLKAPCTSPTQTNTPLDARWSHTGHQMDNLDHAPNMSEPFSSLSLQYPSTGCNCASRLSTALFTLNGMLRKFVHDENAHTTSQIQDASRSVLIVTAQTEDLLNKVVRCASHCFGKDEIRVLLVMIVEQLVDLCSTFVTQISNRPKEPNGDTYAPVYIGDYAVESQRERRMILFLLVSERLDTLTVSAALCRDKLSVMAVVADSQARLSSAIHSLGVLRLKLGSRSNTGME